ncbi:uncharacterized protein LOC135548844 isoform X2 [Oncorhynchus masou masou]|uniref:uncharacterized protein LOC135548844 isoform X2 n=1 Tax=Oncorhynchus masou masou TaxID=90313 RepID=UPI003182C6D9
MGVFQEMVCRLRECVEEAQASSRQGTRDTAAAQHSLRELRLELASTQASHRAWRAWSCWLSRVVRLQVYVVSCPACSRGAPSCQRREGARRRGPGSWLQSSTDYALPADTGRGWQS